MIQEIRASSLHAARFIEDKVRAISTAVGEGTAINALSGGVDSSTVTMLGHKALGKRLRTVFVENGLMRAGEAERVGELFRALNVEVEVVEAGDRFFAALKGVADPEAKREAIAQTFYKEVFGGLVRESGARFLLQGTILTDVDETVAGIKRQHNVFEQLGIDPQAAFGYRILEPLLELEPQLRDPASALPVVARQLLCEHAVLQRRLPQYPALVAAWDRNAPAERRRAVHVHGAVAPGERQHRAVVERDPREDPPLSRGELLHVHRHEPAQEQERREARDLVALQEQRPATELAAERGRHRVPLGGRACANHHRTRRRGEVSRVSPRVLQHRRRQRDRRRRAEPDGRAGPRRVLPVER